MPAGQFSQESKREGCRRASARSRRAARADRICDRGPARRPSSARARSSPSCPRARDELPVRRLGQQIAGELLDRVQRPHHPVEGGSRQATRQNLGYWLDEGEKPAIWIPPNRTPSRSQKSQCSSGVEQLFRKQQVMGSNPITGSSLVSLETAWIQGLRALHCKTTARTETHENAQKRNLSVNHRSTVFSQSPRHFATIRSNSPLPGTPEPPEPIVGRQLPPDQLGGTLQFPRVLHDRAKVRTVRLKPQRWQLLLKLLPRPRWRVAPTCQPAEHARLPFRERAPLAQPVRDRARADSILRRQLAIRRKPRQMLPRRQFPAAQESRGEDAILFIRQRGSRRQFEHVLLLRSNRRVPGTGGVKVFL